MIVLLDLNYTLVANSHEKRRPFTKQIEGEQYRRWLVDLVQDHYTILMTARTVRYRAITLASILAKTNWQPQEAYFNDLDLRPAELKKSVLERFVYPKHGRDASYLALESNPTTRAMYEAQGIKAFRAEEELCKRLLAR